MEKKLYRTEGPDAKIFGVCGGIAVCAPAPVCGSTLLPR